MDINNSGAGVVNTSFGGGQNNILNSGFGTVNANYGFNQTNYTQSGSNNTFNVYQSSAYDIIRWLSPPDPFPNHATARDQHHPGTCEWLLQDERYKRWKAGDAKYLWLTGKPGCGKSVLCSMAIEDSKNVAYFYFTFSDSSKQSYEGMLRSLVWQLAREGPARGMLQQVHDEGQGRADLHKLEEVFVAATVSGQFTIILDALDEIPETRGTRRELLQRLSALMRRANAKLFTTSRKTSDIAEWMEYMQCVEIEASPAILDNDIEQFVKDRLTEDPNLRRYKSEVKEQIMRNILIGADGMYESLWGRLLLTLGRFRWASLLLEKLARMRCRSPRNLFDTLQEFPSSLTQVYHRIIQDLRDPHGDVLKLLRWIAYARQPLTLAELVEVLIINPERDTVDYDNRCEPEDVLRLLDGLIVVVTESVNWEGETIRLNGADRTVRLAHFTIQEYLEFGHARHGDVEPAQLDSAQAHLYISQSCETYLRHYRDQCQKRFHKQDLERFPLLIYAAHSWEYHAESQDALLPEQETMMIELKRLTPADTSSK